MFISVLPKLPFKNNELYLHIHVLPTPILDYTFKLSINWSSVIVLSNLQ